MTVSPLQKALISSVCISSALFTVATAPLALFRSQPIEVQMQNKSVFASEISALAGPYLGIAGVFSVALGTSILGISGWRSAASKSEAEKAKSSELERNLSAYQAELERIKFSDVRLKAQNLEGFLEPQTAITAHSASAPAAEAAAAKSAAPAFWNQAQTFAFQHGFSASEKKPLSAIPAAPKSEAKAQPSPTAEEEFELVMQRLQELAMQVMTKQAPSAAESEATVATAPEPLPAVAFTHGHLGKQSIHASRHLEPVADNQFDLVLYQLHNLAAQVEDLRAGGSSQMVA
ncbi:MAG: hypothetical protein ACTS3T_20520 [Almyronema sp.]